MSQKIVSQRGEKPAKPRKSFPLYAHKSGQWCAKFKGRNIYWDDPDEAERTWERKKRLLLEGRDPNETEDDGNEEPEKVGDLGWLAEEFLEFKFSQVENGKRKQRTYDDYVKHCQRVVDHFGKRRKLSTLKPVDFERYVGKLPESWSAVTTNIHLRNVRALFKYGNDIQCCDRDIPYRVGLAKIPESVIEEQSEQLPEKSFTAKQIRKMIATADQPMKAFLLLGINAGYGPSDVGQLKTSDIDFENKRIRNRRGKTKVKREVWLWPETIEALREAIDAKPWTSDANHESLAFLTRNRRPWWEDGSNSNPVVSAFDKLKKDCHIEAKGVGIYALRHVFETVAGDSRDQIAVNYVMGHKDGSMAEVYRNGIDPKRIKAVCQFVRTWLYGKKRVAK